MDNNMTIFATYTLMEPKNSKSFRHIYFICFLLIYILILLVNAWVSITIILEKALHGPMYIFLCNLCVNDIYGAAGFYPKILHDLILNSYVISSYMCACQVFVIYSSVMCDFTTVTVMAYDRYIAICQPLDYHRKMNKCSCGILLTVCWILPFVYMSACVVLSNRRKLCKYHIPKLYCDNWSMVKLSCEETIINNIYGFAGISFYSGLNIFIFASYIKLIIACKASLECRKKFWQTCVPHMFAVVNYIVAVIFDAMNSRYASSSVSEHLLNFLALQAVIVPPIVNPVIYGLKLQEVRKRILKHLLKTRKQ